MNPSSTPDAGVLTHAEIFGQPALWPDTLERAGAAAVQRLEAPFVLTGAGTSAHAASAVAYGWPGAAAIPTTDLIVETPPFHSGGTLVSFARSGDSPESLAVVDRVQRGWPNVKLLAITCNAQGTLAGRANMDVFLLDPRTNDRSLAMTSSFSNLVLAGLCLHSLDQVAAQLPAISRNAETALERLEEMAHSIANQRVSRVAVLASAPLLPAAREAALKITELSGGNIIALPETFLGLRHGPMAFLRHDALVLCFLSSDPRRRRYEEDVLREIRAKKLGRIVAIAEDNASRLIDERVPAVAAALPDHLRTPFEIVFPQLLAYHLSLRCGLNPDNPSPDGVISRVVQGVTVYDENAGF